MAITTYDELKSSIADWLNRSDLTSVIPTFISLAEADLNRKVRHWRMETRTTLSATGQYLDLPSDWIETVRLKLTGNGTSTLELLSQRDLMERRAARNDVGGQPRYYCVTGGKIELYPSPSEATDVEILYIAQIEALSASNTSNWLLSSHPDAYLYAALLHAAPYLQDDPRVSVWRGLAQNAVQAANLESEQARYSGTGVRMKLRSF